MIGLFPTSTTKIILALIDQSYSVRELAKKTDYSPAKITQFTKKFLKKDIIIITKHKNTKLISLNLNEGLTKQLVSTIMLEQILSTNAIKELKKKVISMGVYGSVAEGNLDKKSDIDLWAIIKKQPSIFEAGKIKQKLSKELNRETTIKFFTITNLQELKQKDPVFFNEIKSKSKILFGGNIE
jgi:predicted nucleotidyltransferase